MPDRASSAPAVPMRRTPAPHPPETVHWDQSQPRRPHPATELRPARCRQRHQPDNRVVAAVSSAALLLRNQVSDQCLGCPLLPPHNRNHKAHTVSRYAETQWQQQNGDRAVHIPIGLTSLALLIALSTSACCTAISNALPSVSRSSARQTSPLPPYPSFSRNV